jgi:hypothetical protein
MPVENRNASGEGQLLVTFAEFVHLSTLGQIRGVSSATSLPVLQRLLRHHCGAYNVYHRHRNVQQLAQWTP